MSVLYVLGGWGSSVYHSSVEKYDVAGDAWTSVASMSQARRTFGSGVVFNSDGSRHLYVVGGQGPNGPLSSARLSSVEKYDPVSNAWTRVADLPAATANGKCGVLKHDDGKQYLYVVGGGDPNSELDSVLRYDPSVDTWTTVTSMASGRTHHGVGVIAHSDGKQYMYAVGGYIGGSQSLDAERYDYATDSWTNIASMTRSYAFTATAVLTHANNQQYLYVLNSGGTNGATSYDSSTNTWTDIANSIVGRNYPGASALTHNDGTQHIYLGGGALQNTVERFDLALGTWTALATWANIRYGPSLVTVRIDLKCFESGGTRRYCLLTRRFFCLYTPILTRRFPSLSRSRGRGL